MPKFVLGLCLFLLVPTAGAHTVDSHDLAFRLDAEGIVKDKIGLFNAFAQSPSPLKLPELAQSHLQKDFAKMMNSRAAMAAGRDQWTRDFFEAVQTYIPPRQRDVFVRKAGSAAAVLYYDLSYQQMADKITALAKLKGYALEVKNLDDVQSPDQCSNVTLYNSKSAAGPFRVLDQGVYGTCYVHSAVRALDYLNLSTGNLQPMTSIAATTFASDRGRPSDRLSVDLGSPLDVDIELSARGGCPVNDFDRSDIAQNYSALETAKAEIDKAFASGLNINSSLALYSQMSPSTVAIVNRIVAKEFGYTLGHLANLKEISEYLTKEIAEYQFESQDPHMFMSFASYIFEKAYCPRERINYGAHHAVSLLNAKAGRDIESKTWRATIDQELHGAYPQPMVLSFCDDVFADPQFRKNPLVLNCARHAAVIVGQDYDNETKQCAYQIVNSWGAADVYHGTYQKNIAQGIVWLPLTQITNAGFNLVVFQPL